MRQGYRILERNWRTRAGELDIVALDDSTVRVARLSVGMRYGRTTPMVFVSADRGLNSAAAAEGVHVLNPTD